MPPEPIRFLGIGAGVIVGGLVITNVVSSAVVRAFRFTIEEKQRKSGGLLVCRSCRGKGFFICRLCKGDATIKWSPLYDPVCINPCLCPTCDGHRFLFVSLFDSHCKSKTENESLSRQDKKVFSYLILKIWFLSGYNDVSTA